MTKKCPRCNLVLEVSKFNWKVKNVKRAAYCKGCSRQYIKNHYYKNTQYYIQKARKNNVKVKQEKIEYLQEYLATHPCIDCGENDILVLEFDHRVREKKFDDVSRILKRRLSLEKLKQEIAKCDVRCANCHRRKTAKENVSWKLTYAPVA